MEKFLNNRMVESKPHKVASKANSDNPFRELELLDKEIFKLSFEKTDEKLLNNLWSRKRLVLAQIRESLK